MPSQQTEPSVNTALGGLLKQMMGACLVRSEHTQLIVGHPAWQLDNLITAPGRSPVVVEAEFMPAYTAEQEAADRLGRIVIGESRAIEAAIALRYPTHLRTEADLNEALQQTRLSWCVLYDELDRDGRRIRFPESGWLEGGIEDLADLIRLVSMPQKEVNRAADSLQAGIERAASVLDEMSETQRGVVRGVADLLSMRNVPQTRRMACAIIANALAFHERIAGMHEGVKPLHMVCGPGVANPQEQTLSAWDQILAINYFPIFAIAKDIVEQLPSGAAAHILAALRETAQEIDAAGIDNAHDLTGRIFQRLIADRKYLATFYTRPASAALLARLAVAKLPDIDWSDAVAIGKLRVGDFACGTGALLSAIYDQISARHERAGGDPAALHATMMEEVLYGCDVMPSAVHITGATLSGAQPNVGYQHSRLYTMPYGRQSDGSVQVGSLELLQSSSLLTLFNTSDPALRTGSAGEETAAQVTVEIPDQVFDLVIMNPPFTRAAADWEGASRQSDYVKQFRGLSTTLDTQKEMSAVLRGYTRDTCYHGYAGIASAFVALANTKLRAGGVLALVLPLSVANGLSWQGVRALFANDYTDLAVVSIAANGDEMSFSADTVMAECLVVARKHSTAANSGGASKVHFTSLTQRPASFAEADAIAKRITGSDQVRALEAGPAGGTAVFVGTGKLGESSTAVTPVKSGTWGSVRVLDSSVAQTAYALTQSQLYPPGHQTARQLPVAQLHVLGTRGMHDINIAGANAPFERLPPSPTATYPSIWNHNHKNETRIQCKPDSQLQAKVGMSAKAAQVWNTASRAHINRDFTFGSQALAVAFTGDKSIGGRVWPNVQFDDPRFDHALAVWGNGTLGLLSHWWHSSRQQSSKASLTVRMLESLPILDFRELHDRQLQTAEDTFEEFRDLQLQPAYLADADPSRALLDRRVICDLLGFDEDIYEGVRRLAAKWCAEPSVHGGKARPPGAKLVI